MIITNVTGSYFLKQNDTATQIVLKISETDGTPVDLTLAPRIEIVIGVDAGRVLTKTPILRSEPGVLEFGLDEGDIIPIGDDLLEVHIYTSSGERRVAPSKGYYKLRVQKPIDELAVEVTTYTLDYFIGEVRRITGDVPGLAQEARDIIESINDIVPRANQVLVDAESASVIASEAVQSANTANTLLGTLIPATQQATAAAQSATLLAQSATTAANNATTNATTQANAAQAASVSANSAAASANTAAQAVQSVANTANALVNELSTLEDNLAGYETTISNFNINVTYLKHQTVRFNGSTYRAKQQTTGNELPVAPSVENGWWALVAQRGTDGNGAVGSVNGTLPDENGNVVLPLQEELTKLVSHQFTVKPTTDGQTTIDIPLGTFNKDNDTLVLFRNTTAQSPATYSVSGKTITLVEPVADAATTEFHMLIMSNVITGTITSEIQAILDGFDNDIESVDNRLTARLDQNMNITDLLGIKSDGTDDISMILQTYSQDKDEIYLHFPKGRYRWDNNVKLTNKKIKFTGDYAVIEHYGSGTNLEIGDVTTHSTEDFFIQGIDFVNKRPKPATGGSGVTALSVADALKTTIRDVNVFDTEQYGILLRRQNGTLKQVVLDNVNVYRTSGTLATTTSIALETRANSGDGKIENLKISNCYFEVVDSYTNSGGTTTTVALSNAAKLQACDEIEMVNVTFVGGKENGPLTFAFDTKKVKMTNVVLKSNSSASKGITISFCPNLELDAVNCELGVDNFVQSIGINDSLRKAKFVNCKLGLLTEVSGTTENFEFNACEFILRSALSMRFDKSIFNNCSISPSSANKNIILAGNNNRIVNFVGVEVLEISGNDNKIIGGDFTVLRPNGSSARGYAKGVKATSSDRALQINANTVADWVFEDCTFERTVAGGTSYFGLVQGLRNKVLNCTFRQLDKTATVGYAVAVINATDCEVIEKKNNFDVNKTAAYNINITNSTGTRQYLPGDTFLNGARLQIWDGTKFVNLTTTTA